MKYIKLFAPLIIGFSLNMIWEIYSGRPDPTVTTILKFGLLIYYLRLDNSGTPLINTLTVTLILMGLGEYFLKSYTILGQILYCSSACAFGLFYFMRQTQKPIKDRLLKVKVSVVFLFLLFGILTVFKLPTLVPLTIVGIILIFVFFYDRLTNRQTT